MEGTKGGREGARHTIPRTTRTTTSVGHFPLSFHPLLLLLCLLFLSRIVSAMIHWIPRRPRAVPSDIQASTPTLSFARELGLTDVGAVPRYHAQPSTPSPLLSRHALSRSRILPRRKEDDFSFLTSPPPSPFLSPLSSSLSLSFSHARVLHASNLCLPLSRRRFRAYSFSRMFLPSRGTSFAHGLNNS